jgi:hypothetical protein
MPDHLVKRKELLHYGAGSLNETFAEIEISERYVAPSGNYTGGRTGFG